MFLQIGNCWVNTQHITSIQLDDERNVRTIKFGEKEEDGAITFRDPAEVEALLHWLNEKAPSYILAI